MIINLSKNRNKIPEAGRVLAKVMRGPPYYAREWLPVKTAIKTIRDILKKTHGVAYAYEHEGKIVGVGGAHALKDFLSSPLAQGLTEENKRMFGDPERNYYMDFVAVLEEHRRKGIARLLTEEREAYAIQNGYTYVSFRTLNPARIALAKEMGYDELFSHDEGREIGGSKTTKRVYLQKRL